MGKQVNTNSTKLIRIDAGMHRTLKLIATQQGRSIKSLVEEVFADYIPDVLEGKQR